MRRIKRDGSIVRELRVELPQELYRRLELEKERSGRSLNAIVGQVLEPWLRTLPDREHSSESRN